MEIPEGLTEQEKQIAIQNLKSSDEHLVLRTFQRMKEEKICFIDAFRKQCNIEKQITQSNLRYMNECLYWDQQNELYKQS